MRSCIICKKTIPVDRELCDEHRDVLNAIFVLHEKDPEFRGRWDGLVELLRAKDRGAEGDEVDTVLDFIDEIKSESGK